MLKQIKKLTVRIATILNVLVIVAMLSLGLTDHIHPQTYPVLSTFGLGFPLLLGANVVFLVFWLLVHWKGVWLPIAGLVIGYLPIRTYTPFNFPQSPPADAIKVLSYNVYQYDIDGIGEDGKSPIIEYIKESKADIVCLQESPIHHQKVKKAIASLDSLYQYCDTTCKKENGSDCLTVYSRFPILSKEYVKYSSKANMTMAYVLDINGEQVLLVNNHFESNRLTSDDKDSFSHIVKGNASKREAKRESKQLLQKLGKAAKIRAPQAESVARYVKKRLDQGMSVIVCGDFNDHPLSYAHRIVSAHLTDCFIASGNGPGYTYHKNNIYVRIDHILCSDDWEPYAAKVDTKVTNSDHYPIYCWLKKRPKP